MNLLLIEDNPYTREMMAVFLSEMGHNVKALDSLKNLAEKIDGFISDITFTDVELDEHELSGSYMSELSDLAKGKIVALTGRSYESLNKTVRDNLFHFINKPVDFDEIDKVIAQVQSMKQEAQEV